MTNIVGKARDALGGDRRLDADALTTRVEAVGRFLRAVDGNLPDDRLAAAHTLVERAGTRLALSRDHTVVALAGATGSGKSSLFNALARFELSPAGVRRPTTGVTHACVWGALDGATGLLDWVGVLPRHRFVRESLLDGDDEVRLHGLILLDLPDFDSVEQAHWLEVGRLLGLVDLVVWVVDPQKYADRVVHASYLREFDRYRDVTVVVLNQVDRLPPAEVPKVVADLRRLLDADHLGGVPLLTTSAFDPATLTELRSTLERAVTERQAVLRRLASDVDAVTEQLAEVMGPPAAEDDVDRATVGALADALAASAGVSAVVEATEQAYRHRAARTTGWPLVRGWRRVRPDPLRRLQIGDAADTGTARNGDAAGKGTAGKGIARDGDAAAASPVAATSVPDPTAAQRSAVGLAVRTVADHAGAALPAPWRVAVATAARSRLDSLPGALDRAVASTDLGLDRKPVWWRLVGAVQWLVTLAALTGLGWLVVGYAVRVLGLPPLDYPTLAGVLPVPTLLLVGGLLLGLVVLALVNPVIRWASGRARRGAEKRLRAAVTEVGREYVVAPVRAVLQSYAQAREALAVASSR